MKVSKTGYKKNYNKNEPALIVPSSEITMKENNGEPLEKGPILGIDNLGNMTIMQPGLDYSFPGSYVYEIPMANAKNGGYILPGRYRNPEGNWVSVYTYGGDISIPDLSRPNWLDKYQPGGGVHQKIYNDPLKFAEANKLYNDSLGMSIRFPYPPKGYKIYPYEFSETAQYVVGQDNEGNNIVEYRKNERSKNEPIGLTKHLAGKSGKTLIKNTNKYEDFIDSQRPIYKQPTEEPVYVEKPAYVVETKKDTYMPPSNTAEVLSKTKEEDTYNQAPKVVPAPDFRSGGWLDTYQVGGSTKPMTWTDYLESLGINDPKLTSIDPKSKLDKSTDGTLAYDSYNSATRNRPQTKSVLEDADLMKRSRVVDMYNALFWNKEKQDYSGTNNEKVDLDESPDGNTAMDKKDAINYIKNYYSTPTEDLITSTFTDQSQWGNRNLRDVPIEYTHTAPKSGLTYYNRPNWREDDPRFSEENMLKNFGSYSSGPMYENFYEDWNFKDPKNKVSQIRGYDPTIEFQAFPKPSYNYSNVPKRYDEKGNEVISREDLPNVQPNTYYDFPGSLTEDIYQKKNRLNQIYEQNVKNLKAFDPNAKAKIPTSGTEQVDFLRKEYASNPYMFYGDQNLEDQYCTHCEKLSGSEHTTEGAFDFFKFKPQYPSSKEWLKSQMPQVNREIIQVRNTPNPTNRTWSQAVQNKYPGMGTQDYATTVRVGTDMYPVTHTGDLPYGEFEADGKKQYITYEKNPKGGYNPIISETQPVVPKVVKAPTFKSGGWLERYQDGKQVERRDPNQLFFESPTESDTYQTQYSQPEVTVTPNWTEGELERNKLRDDYIAKDKKAWRHWYDKLGYDKDNVTKRANQFAYNKLAKQYLKGDKEKLTPEQRKFIEKSEYANRLQPSIGSRFVEGVTNPGLNLQTVGNLMAPFEYPGNLVRGAVMGEFADAVKGQTPSPYFVSSDLAGTSPTEAAIMSSLLTAGTDPLFLTGDEIFRGVGQGAKSAGKYLTTQTPLKNTYKYNPWAFKVNEDNWYRQVGKSAIDDALATGVIREAGEEVSPRMWGEFQDQIKRLRGEGIEDSYEKMKQSVLAGRRPASPFFAKGELFYPMGRKPTTTKTGKISKNPAGKGSSDYLIETGLPNESFQPAYVKGMDLGVPQEIGSTAILKPDPSLRNLQNFKLYKQDWLQGYRQINKSKQLPGSPNNILSSVNSKVFNQNYGPLFKFYDEYGYVPDYTVGKSPRNFEFVNPSIHRNIHPSDLEAADNLGYVVTPHEQKLGIDAALAEENAIKLKRLYDYDNSGVMPGQAGRIDGYYPFFMEGTKLFDTKTYPRPLLRFNPEKAPLVNTGDSFLSAENISFHPRTRTPYRVAVPNKATRQMSNYDVLTWDSKLNTYVPAKGGKLSQKNLLEESTTSLGDPTINRITGPGPLMLGLSKYTHEVKNPAYFQKMLDSYSTNKLPDSSKKYFQGIIKSVEKQGGLATRKQYDMLQRLRTGDFNYGKKEYGGSLDMYQDGSQVPQSWKDKYDWTPNVEEEYQQFKNDPSAPENLRFTDDMKDYNTRGMWDSLDRPSNWQQALDLHRQQQGYEWTPEDDGYYHAWSQHPGTGEWLKPRHHSTGWMNNMGYAFDPENTVVVNPEGFFGNETLQAYPKQKKKDGGQSQGEGYYDYINGYSGIFANGGSKGWLDNYK